MQYLLKIIISAVLITLISEIAKSSSFWGAVLASLPATSLIAFIFLYTETGDAEKVSSLSTAIFWLVIPSLVLFLALPILIKKGLSFYPAFGISCLLTIASYFAMSWGLKKFGILI